MHSETIAYTCGDSTFKGHLAYDQTSSTPRPVVIVAHAWKGQDDFAREKAEMLAKLGYVGFAADLYGDGKTVESNDEAMAMMSPLFVDRKTLRERIVSAYQTVAKLDIVDETKVGAIGFCFGGLTVIELLRSGVPLRGVVSFHGLLGDTVGDLKAISEPTSEKIQGSLLILHGHKDPLVSTEDIIDIQQDMINRQVDWQMYQYGNASHAFTNPHANDPEMGLLYHAVTEKRSLQAMRNFFNEVFE